MTACGLTLVHSAPPPPATDLTSRDLIALARWIRLGDSHGYRRILVEGGLSTGGPEDRGYVLIYAADSDWASWGVARTDGGISLWHCGTGHDVGRFPTMQDALQSLPPVTPSAVHTSRQRVSPSPALPRLHVVPRTSPEALPESSIE